MTELSRLRALNPELFLNTCDDPAFAAYGRVLTGLDCAGLVAHLKQHAAIGDGTAYLRSVPGLEDLPGPALPLPFDSETGRGGTLGGSTLSPGATPIGPLPHSTWKQYFKATVFGGLPVQIGWVVGRNTGLNALEYHKSSEITVAATDLILLVGQLSDIQDYKSYDPARVRGFLLHQGQAVETWSTTLHFAPVMTSTEGFRAAIVLPAETNAPLEAVNPGQDGEPGLLWAVNKWLIACPGSGPAGKGAHVGIHHNLEVRI